MTTHELLLSCHAGGIQLAVDGDALDVDAPAGALTPALVETLRAHKGELLAVIWRLAEMRRLPAPASRAVVAREAARGGPGHCFSCGDPHPSPDWYGRCPACNVAADIFYSTCADFEA
jgi:hypothetical protein